MFVHWKKVENGGASIKHLLGLSILPPQPLYMSLYATVRESRRGADGKVHTRDLFYLGGIKEHATSFPYARRHFWQSVEKHLAKHADLLTPEQRLAVIEQLAAVVPIEQ